MLRNASRCLYLSNCSARSLETPSGTFDRDPLMLTNTQRNIEKQRTNNYKPREYKSESKEDVLSSDDGGKKLTHDFGDRMEKITNETAGGTVDMMKETGKEVKDKAKGALESAREWIKEKTFGK